MSKDRMTPEELKEYEEKMQYDPNFQVPLGHLFTCLMEECSEVQQACSKILRFGVNSTNPYNGKKNFEEYSDELNDLFTIVSMISQQLPESYLPNPSLQTRKREKLIKYYMANMANMEKPKF